MCVQGFLEDQCRASTGTHIYQVSAGPAPVHTSKRSVLNKSQVHLYHVGIDSEPRTPTLWHSYTVVPGSKPFILTGFSKFRNTLAAKLFKLNFHPLEVVSR